MESIPRFDPKIKNPPISKIRSRVKLFSHRHDCPGPQIELEADRVQDVLAYYAICRTCRTAVGIMIIDATTPFLSDEMNKFLNTCKIRE